MAEQIKAWSFSRYQTYRECPAKAKYKYIDKLPEPDAPAAAEGTRVHKLAEDYTTGALKKFPVELVKFKDEFDEVKQRNPEVEAMWAYDKLWKPTGWFDWNAWVRVKTDLNFVVEESTLFIIDHKNGKKSEEHKEQLSLYGVGGMVQYPKVENVVAQIWYLKTGDIVEEQFYPKDQLKLRKQWNDKTRAMLNDTTFAPKPGNGCRWCTFSKSKGGPCKF